MSHIKLPDGTVIDTDSQKNPLRPGILTSDQLQGPTALTTPAVSLRKVKSVTPPVTAPIIVPSFDERARDLPKPGSVIEAIPEEETTLLTVPKGAETATPSLPEEETDGGIEPERDLDAPVDFVSRVRDVLKSFGIEPPVPGQSPITNFAETYRNLLKESGVQDLKSQAEGIAKQYEGLQNEMNDQIQTVNENPFLSEGERAGRVQSIQKKYETRLNTLTNRLNLTKSLVESARDEAQFIAQQSLQLAGAEQKLDRDLLLKAIERAEKSLEAETKLLSVGEAKDLGVPFGTTVAQAKALGKTPLSQAEITTPREAAKDEANLRKEFNMLPIAKDFNDINRSHNQVRSAYSEALAAGSTKSKAAADQVLITAFNKLIDPTSVVREGEYARTTTGQSVINQLRGIAERAIQGGAGLADPDRKAIVSVVERLFNDYLTVYNNTSNFYREIATQSGLNPDRVIQPPAQQQKKEETRIYKGRTYKKVQGGWQLIK